MEKYYYAPASSEETEQEKEHGRTAVRIAEETIVLLKNNGILPLNPAEKKIALYGSGARNTIVGGSGSGEVVPRRKLSLEQVFQEAGYEISSVEWMNQNDLLIEQKHGEYMEEKRRQAEESGVDIMNLILEDHFTPPDVIRIEESELADAETVIYVISRSAGEGADRKLIPGDYYLSEHEFLNLKRLSDSDAKVIVLLNTSGVIDMSWVSQMQGIDAIVNIGQLGGEGSRAVLRILEGTVTPSGKLASTWAKNYEDYPSAATFSHQNGNLDDEYYEEDVYVGYRYFDAMDIEPQYEFGFGLSYTEFRLSGGGFEVRKRERGDVLCVDVMVKNTGAYPGKEVVQIYAGRPLRAGKALTAFEKTKLLAPGEIQMLSLSAALPELAVYDESRAAWVITKGYYPVYMGNSSRNVTVVGYLRAEEDILTEQLDNQAAGQLEHILEPDLPRISLEDGKPVIGISAENVVVGHAKYNLERPLLIDHFPDTVITAEDVKAGRYTLDDLAAQLTPEEMAELCVGSFGEDKVQIVMGASSSRVPGAGGNTTVSMKDTRNIENLIMADGPVGLRLTPHFQIDQNGKLKIPQDLAPSEEEGVTDYYQFCTALPIASNMAQSWNRELLRKEGKIIGEEMRSLGVSLWLAPGMNIHRNPLGGRCFEYYSEDPYLTGVCAAEVTKAVQAIPGRGVVLKHYAANNQEDNRMYTNVHITEKALREIYLKGFGKAIREADPTGIMTSYNLVNGTHSANHRELLDKIARSEFGFRGLIMTDWFATYDMQLMMRMPKQKYDRSHADLCIKAGNDLVMPGGDNCVREILEGYKNGTVELSDLQYCAKNILGVILRLK